MKKKFGGKSGSIIEIAVDRSHWISCIVLSGCTVQTVKLFEFLNTCDVQRQLAKEG